MKTQGNVWKFGANINTDLIFPNKHFKPRYMPGEIASHIMSGVDPDFFSKISRGDIILGGRNFGCGSSREEAAGGMREAGIGALVAPSFGRIFMRNCINVGVPVISCTGIDEHVSEGNILEIDLDAGCLRNLTTGFETRVPTMAPQLLALLREGGLVEYTRRQLSDRMEPSTAP